MREEQVTDRILKAVHLSPGCFIEELVLACPDLTWNQVFLEVDRLSRAGLVRLTLKGPGLYSVMPKETMRFIKEGGSNEDHAGQVQTSRPRPLRTLRMLDGFGPV